MKQLLQGRRFYFLVGFLLLVSVGLVFFFPPHWNFCNEISLEIVEDNLLISYPEEWMGDKNSGIWLKFSDNVSLYNENQISNQFILSLTDAEIFYLYISSSVESNVDYIDCWYYGNSQLGFQRYN